MSSQKKIEINQSSLLGLKAELERKKKEVESVKWKVSGFNQNVRIKTKTKKEKSERKSVKEADGTAEDAELLEESKTMLEVKVKAYESLCGNRILGEPEIDSSEFLVDFAKKKEEEKETSDDDFFSDDCGEEWIDYVDCLGRTKRCHRDDYQDAMERDRSLKVRLFCDSHPKEEKSPVLESFTTPAAKDAKKEEMREKWEEQEQILLDKKEVHYQDILFNEARSHGVGYYEFSTDEQERRRQQEALKRSRDETLKRQAFARDVSEKKKKQTEERLKAARKRKRQRLGLPPEEEIILNENENGQVEKESEKTAESSGTAQPAEPARGSKKPPTVRPWDLGKVSGSKVLSQEEWVERKRSERISEFAPPTKQWLPSRKYHKDPKEEKSEPLERKRGAQIPPPEFYSASSKKISPNIEKSIEEGLKFLREQVDRKRENSSKEIYNFN